MPTSPSSIPTSETPRATSAVVSSHNEWDPLEEVVVGQIWGTRVPAFDASIRSGVPSDAEAFYREHGNGPWPSAEVELAAAQLEGLCAILAAEGVNVRRSAKGDPSHEYATPSWRSPGGIYAAMPRDVALVVGDDIIEAPMAWRSRYFEIFAYRSLFKEYFRAGARWSSAPKPEMADELYDEDFDAPGGSGRLVTEFEPVFDAADFVRLGRDIVGQTSNVTNQLGMEWLARHLGPRYRVHDVRFDDPHPMHIDATIVPLAPGKLLVNPERVKDVPSIFRGWDILRAPTPAIPASHPMRFCSRWVNMNVLSLDEQRVVIEAEDEPMRRALVEWGFKPVPVPFRWFNTFGGSFHCATLDVRRRGELQSYL